MLILYAFVFLRVHVPLTHTSLCNKETNSADRKSFIEVRQGSELHSHSFIHTQVQGECPERG